MTCLQCGITTVELYPKEKPKELESTEGGITIFNGPKDVN